MRDGKIKKKVCWHYPLNKQLVLNMGSNQTTIHQIWIYRGVREEGIARTGYYAHNTRLFQAGHPGPVSHAMKRICSLTPISYSETAMKTLLA